MNDLNDSPLSENFDSFDMKHTDWTYRDYQQYAANMELCPPEQINSLLKEEVNWKFEHGQNIVASMEGPQGKGKSMPFSSFGLFLGSVYGKKFTPDNIYFLPEELEEALSNADERQTFMRDEHLYSRVGMMSHMINDNLSDYEEQLRINQNNLLFCSVELQNHAHFLCFEAKHTIWTIKNEKIYPKKFYAMLSTPRYTDRKCFVWRGFVSFQMPPEDFTEAYDKRKRNHIKNLQNKYGDTLKQVSYVAQNIFKEHEKELIKVLNNGLVKSISSIRLMKVIKNDIGTRRFTKEGYAHLIDEIKQEIEEKYSIENEEIIEKAMLEANERKEASIIEQNNFEKEIELRRKRKAEFQIEKLEEIKRKNDLKEKLIELKEKELSLKKEKKEEINEKFK